MSTQDVASPRMSLIQGFESTWMRFPATKWITQSYMCMCIYCIYIYAYAYAYVYMHTCIYCINMQYIIYIYTYMYMHTHTYVYIHIYMIIPKSDLGGVGRPHFVEPNLTFGAPGLYRMRNLPQI